MTTLAHLAALLPLLLRRACVGQPHLSTCELAAVRRECEDSSISARRIEREDARCTKDSLRRSKPASSKGRPTWKMPCCHSAAWPPVSDAVIDSGSEMFSSHIATSMARHGIRVARKAHLHGDVVGVDTCANAPFVQPWYRYLIQRAVGDYCCRYLRR